MLLQAHPVVYDAGQKALRFRVTFADDFQDFSIDRFRCALADVVAPDPLGTFK